MCWVPVAHTCNPSSSGGRDQYNHCLKLAQANSLRDPISKIAIHNKAGGMAQAAVRLPSKCETLSSNPKNLSTIKKNNNKDHV
jgi:hypothetical protein